MKPNTEKYKSIIPRIANIIFMGLPIKFGKISFVAFILSLSNCATIFVASSWEKNKLVLPGREMHINKSLIRLQASGKIAIDASEWKKINIKKNSYSSVKIDKHVILPFNFWEISELQKTKNLHFIDNLQSNKISEGFYLNSFMEKGEYSNPEGSNKTNYINIQYNNCSSSTDLYNIKFNDEFFLAYEKYLDTRCKHLEILGYDCNMLKSKLFKIKNNRENFISDLGKFIIQKEQECAFRPENAIKRSLLILVIPVTLAFDIITLPIPLSYLLYCIISKSCSTPLG